MNSGPIFILAGGTGGHVYPALAVAKALQQRSHKIIWLGTHHGIEARVVPQAGIDMEWINTRGLRGKGVITLLLAPFRLLLALFQSLSAVLRHRPAVVLGMGGYVSGPGGVAAWILRRPLVIHEQNAVAGLTNRLLARLARVVLQAFPGSFTANINAETVGNPVRADISALPDPVSRFAKRDGPLRLLVLGGSQGALALNRAIPGALAMLSPDNRPLVKHQTGALTLDQARAAYAEHSVNAELLPFIDDMAQAYAWADLVVCRAGALTVAELQAAGVPAIFIPFPAAVDDHQTANAGTMAGAGAAQILQERDLSDERLATTLKTWLVSRDALCAKATVARSLGYPQALARITNICLEVAGAPT